MNRKAWVGILILYLNKYLSDVAVPSRFPTVVYGTSWIRERMGSDGEWQFIPSSPHPTPLTDMSHSLMTLLCSLSLHLICVSVKLEQPTPAPLDSRANTHPFNDIRFGVMPFSIALILSSICIIQPGDTARARPIESWSFPHPFPLWWQMSRWKLTIIYLGHVFITHRHDVSLYSRLSANASEPVFLWFFFFFSFWRVQTLHPFSWFYWRSKSHCWCCSPSNLTF